MSWWAIGTAAVNVIGGAINNNQAKKNAGKVVPYENVDLQKQQADAITGNLGAQNSIEALLGRANQFQQAQASSLYNQAMPGYKDLSASLTNQAQKLADNPYDVPADVTKNLERLAAERGISAGTKGEFNDFSLLRDFGVNSLQYGQSNLAQAQSITGLLAGIAPKVNPMSPLAFYVSPQESAAAATNNSTNNQYAAQSGVNAQNLATNTGNTDLWANLSKLAGAGIEAYGKSGSSNTNYVTPNNYPIGSSGSINGVSPAGAH